MFSKRFAKAVADHLKSVDAMVEVYKFDDTLDITWENGAGVAQRESAIIEVVENALFNRILGMGAGAGAERYGGGRRRRRITRPKKHSRRQSKRLPTRRTRQNRPYR
jgi:hypothetical protein